MNVFDPAGLRMEPLDPATFSGTGTLTRMPGLSESPALNAYRVSFEPGARTDWHIHSGAQILVVLEGRCRIQKAGEPPVDVDRGVVVSIPAGEKHWHGATPDGQMTHLALNVDASTEWLDRVTEGEYEGL